jgi:hypothetical protein
MCWCCNSDRRSGGLSSIHEKKGLVLHRHCSFGMHHCIALQRDRIRHLVLIYLESWSIHPFIDWPTEKGRVKSHQPNHTFPCYYLSLSSTSSSVTKQAWRRWLVCPDPDQLSWLLWLLGIGNRNRNRGAWQVMNESWADWYQAALRLVAIRQAPVQPSAGNLLLLMTWLTLQDVKSATAAATNYLVQYSYSNKQEPMKMEGFILFGLGWLIVTIIEIHI